MFKITWDKETGGVRLSSKIVEGTLGVSPRPVFFEELDLLGLNRLPDGKAWEYPHCKEPLLWACNKQYYYHGDLVFEAKGANIYDSAKVELSPNAYGLVLEPVNVAEMLERNKDEMFLIESEALEFIRDTYVRYSSNKRLAQVAKANRLDYEALAEKAEKQSKTKMAIVKEDCDSFDIMPLDVANEQGKSTYATTQKIDRFLASFSGGKDSQVVLDLCTRAIPSQSFEVIYSDTGYELPPSLDLYKEIQDYYHQKFPDLKFSTTKNHESVLNYWDKIGTPSDKHRWCCSVMKTAPLYRSLKLEGNKQARVLTFDGVRAEENTRRAGYNRIGKGVKHDTVINARPILEWNATEIFIYLFKHSLHINPAYRMGMTRVGCLICPYSSEWNEMIVSKSFKHNLSPFINKLEANAKKGGIKDINDYIKDGGWKRRASGNLIEHKSFIEFKSITPDFKAEFTNPSIPILAYLFTIGPYSTTQGNHCVNGELKYKKEIYKFQIVEKGGKQHEYTFTMFNIADAVLIGLLKRVFYKATYCISCEACEVECPTGALSVYPSVTIDRKKCIHCHKCLTFHDKGCIVANSLTITTNYMMNKQQNIDRYKNFGLKTEWLEMYLLDLDNFWESGHGLNPTYQVPSLKNWLKDADIIDEKCKATELGKVLASLYTNRPDLVWQIVWINLTSKSFIASWYSKYVEVNSSFTTKLLEERIMEQYPTYKAKTVHNAVYQVQRLLKESPIGTSFEQFMPIDKQTFIRRSFNNVDVEAIAYSIYKYGEDHKVRSLRLSRMYEPTVDGGIVKEFAIEKSTLELALRTLNSAKDRILIAELNLGLDNITLREDLDSVSALKVLLKDVL